MESPFQKITLLKSAVDVNDYLTDKPRLNLIPLKDKFDSNLLHHCTFNNELEKMKVLVRHMKTYFYNSPDQGYDSTPANQFKLNMQAWVNQPNNEGYLPAHYACLYGNVEMLHYLEELGTNLLYKSNAGQTLLHMCAQNNQLSPMLYLSTKDIDFNQVDREKETPLHQASGKGYVEIVNFLAALPQVDLNPLNHREETPLMLAVREGKTEVVKKLLIKGADRSIPNGNGQTVMDIAVERGNEKIQAILKEDYSCIDKTLILCNKKTVYRPQKRSSLLVFLFLFLFITSIVTTHAIIQIQLEYLVVAGVFYLILFVIYIMLLRRPDERIKQPFNTLQPPICAECQVHMPPKTYHCFICQRCIYRYDHHCPWINNCVGWHNAGRFTLFLYLLVLSLLELCFMNVYYGFIIKEPQYKFDFPHRDIVFLCLHIYNFLIFLFIVPVFKLLTSQTKTLLLNKTGYQRHRNPPKRQKQSLLNDESTVTASQIPTEGYSLFNCCKMCQEPPEQYIE